MSKANKICKIQIAEAYKDSDGNDKRFYHRVGTALFYNNHISLMFIPGISITGNAVIFLDEKQRHQPAYPED